MRAVPVLRPLVSLVHACGVKAEDGPIVLINLECPCGCNTTEESL